MIHRITLFFLTAFYCHVSVNVQAAEILPLAGSWRFAMDRNDTGTNEGWYSKSLPDKINLPGILEAQGYGDEISINTPWVLSLYDHYWYLRPEYAAYTKAGNVKVPFLCQPQRHYVGVAWYQRDIDIPQDWSGKRVMLFLERPHWKSTVWLDDHEIGSDISLCTPHQYEMGLVVARASRPSVAEPNQKLTGETPVPLPITPGKHHLTIRVDNRMILPYRPDAHSVSDSLDDAWNGIIGKMELRATSPVWIKEARVFSDTNNDVTIKVKIGNLTGRYGKGLLSMAMDKDQEPGAGIQPIEWTTNGATRDFVFSLGKDAKRWDEFGPNLEHIFLRLSGEHAEDQVPVTFGLRELHTEKNQFILNGRPIYFRGTHFGGDFPLTGYPPTDVESWSKIFLTCKEYGLNHMRFHSWCPPEAAFEAADKLGFYLQVECGMWNEISPGSRMEAMLYDETERILRDFGNHPSCMLLSAMNEAHGNWQPSLTKWVKHFREEDPRRLYTPDTGWSTINSPTQPLNGGADYLVVGRIGSGGVRGVRGWYGSDYGDSIAGVSVPVVGHEVGQWVAYPDFEVIKKFTGFMQPGNYEIFRDSAAAHGVLDMDKQFAWASGRFQLACYKEEIEANLRTPGMGGFQLLDLHDYTGQGTALVGLLDALWGSKGYVAADELKHFCNSAVPLARLAKRVFTTADQLEAPVEIANFGATALTHVTTKWTLLDSHGQSLADGEFAPQTIPLGKNLSLGKISVDLSKLPAPREIYLDIWASPNPKDSSNEARFAASQAIPLFQNNWNLWLYPSTQPAAAPSADILETSSFDEAEQALAQGKKVLLTPRNADLDWSSPPLARVPVFWNALMGPTWSRMLGLCCDVKSPALSDFPTEANCDWQWTELLHNTRAINLDKLPGDLKPIVWAIDDWNRNYKLGLIFEARAGAGKLLVCAADLKDNSSPVAQQLRTSLLNYMTGGKFAPKIEISLNDLKGLQFNTRIMHDLGASATADGHRASELVDGDPNTFWASADARGNSSPYPHAIVISFPKPTAMDGLVVMPRQNHREHQGAIREYRLETSDDGTNWMQIASGELVSSFDEQKLLFSRTATATQLKLTALSGFGADHSTGLADLAVIYAGPKFKGPDSNNVEYKNVRTASPDIDAGDAPGNKPGQKPPRN